MPGRTITVCICAVVFMLTGSSLASMITDPWAEAGMTGSWIGKQRNFPVRVEPTKRVAARGEHEVSDNPYGGDSTKDILSQTGSTAVPEPATMLLIGTGLILLARLKKIGKIRRTTVSTAPNRKRAVFQQDGPCSHRDPLG